MRDWLGATWELAWGVLTRFWIWILPFVFLQPLDLLEKVGVKLVIPDQVVFGLVGLGVFASAVDVVRDKRSQLADAASREDARGITGTVELSPFLMPIGSDETGVWVRPMVRLENKGNQPVLYLIQRFDVKIQAHGRIWKTDETIGDEDMLARQLAPEIGSRLPTSAYTIAPQAYMDAVGPTQEFGPYPGLNPIDVEYELLIRLSRPFGRSTVVEHRFFNFRAGIQDGRTSSGGKTGASFPAPGRPRLRPTAGSPYLGASPNIGARNRLAYLLGAYCHGGLQHHDRRGDGATDAERGRSRARIRPSGSVCSRRHRRKPRR